jgi:Mrp family chromosome partitioning ATPase
VGSRSSEQHALLTDYDNVSAYSQAFYTCFTNLRSQWENAQETSAPQKQSLEIHTLLITSPATYTNQPIVAANLAIVAAQSGAETILVDTDLHHSALRQSLGLPQERGLGDLLAEEEEITPQIIASHLQQTFVPGLQFLGTGTPSTQGTTLLLSSRLKLVIAAIHAHLAATDKASGIAIFHSTPVLSGADAALIGTLTQQTVLTIILGQTTRTQAKQAQEQLQQAHIELAGVIMLHP